MLSQHRSCRVAVLASQRVSAANAGVADAEWDFALQRMGGHFLQSTLWQRVQTALGHDVIWARDEEWMWAGAIRAGRFPRYVYLPHGPTALSAAAMTDALADAVDAARERSLDFVRAEPGGCGRAAGARERRARRPSRSIQPRWTWVLDLTPDEATLRRGLERRTSRRDQRGAPARPDHPRQHRSRRHRGLPAPPGTHRRSGTIPRPGAVVPPRGGRDADAGARSGAVHRGSGG